MGAAMSQEGLFISRVVDRVCLAGGDGAELRTTSVVREILMGLPEYTTDVAAADVLAELRQVNDSIRTWDDVRVFRNWPDDDSFVIRLIPYAASPVQEVRKAATGILVNVVDNTNVCHVVDYLQDHLEMPIDIDGRYNLVLVLRQDSKLRSMTPASGSTPIANVSWIR